MCEVIDGERRLMVPASEGAFWYLWFKLDLSRLSVDKRAFVDAVNAEGLAAEADHPDLFTLAPRYKNKAVSDDSGYPWTCPLYSGDPNAEWPLPKVTEANDGYFRIDIHERLGVREAEQVIAVLVKVESAFSRP